MGIEEEIKQTRPFNNEYQKLVINILFTSSWLGTMHAQSLKPYGITPAQYNVLRILRGKYPEAYSNQEITERMIDKSSNSTRIVDKLKLKGLIARTENISDRRLVDIKITEKGLDLLKEVESGSNNLKKHLRNITPEQAKLMNEWLDNLRS
jgi:DNA-binding MarR family transcriptional regulator